MAARERFLEAMGAAGIPCWMGKYRGEGEVPVPYAVYKLVNEPDMSADDEVVADISVIDLKLYTAQDDLQLREMIRNGMDAHGFALMRERDQPEEEASSHYCVAFDFLYAEEA